MAKVLIVEDDDVIARRDGAATWQPPASSRCGRPQGEQGLARLRFERPDVCVLDLMLPGRDGWKLIETARAEGIGTPIVVVSARGTEHDRVHALEIGADDYLVKPFSMEELVARVKAAARRGVRAQDDRRAASRSSIEELLIDPREVQAYVDGENVGPDARPSSACSTRSRSTAAASSPATSCCSASGAAARRHRDRTVDVFVRKLRDKIDRRAPRHTFIQTRYGVGYTLEAVPKGESEA